MVVGRSEIGIWDAVWLRRHGLSVGPKTLDSLEDAGLTSAEGGPKLSDAVG